MFGKNEKKSKASKDVKHIDGFVGKGMRIDGTLSFDGTVTIEGSIKGNVVSGGILIVGDGGKIDGDIDVDNVIVHGEVDGTINAKTRVELNSPGKVRGDIRTPNLIICDGVIFEGNCHMGGNVSELTTYKAEKGASAGSAAVSASPVQEGENANPNSTWKSAFTRDENKS